MSRSRRLFVWLPIVALTLFFVACGWRNAHLQSDEHDVWLQSALYAARHLPNQPSYMVDVSDKDAQGVERALKQRQATSQMKLFSIKSEEMPTVPPEEYPFPWVQVGKPVLQNRFHATSEISFGAPSKNGNSGDWHSNVLTFTRSPLTFWDDQWHLVSIE